MQLPRVAICMMAYQHEKYVRHALNALVAQTCQSFKLIAIDDGSTDATYRILKEYEYGILRGRMTVLTHPDHQNCGIYAGYRRCLENLDTEFFMPHASDDLLKPDAIAYLLDLMDRSPNADFAYGPCEVIDSAGRRTGHNHGSENIGDGLEALRILLDGNPVREPSMFFRAKCSHVITDVRFNIVYGDWLHNLTFFVKYKPLRYAYPASLYRLHGDNVSIVEITSKAQSDRHAAVLLAALSQPLLSSDSSCNALILLSGRSLPLATNQWPSATKIAKKLLMISSQDITRIVQILNRRPLRKYDTLVAVILTLRAPITDGLAFSCAQLLSWLAKLHPHFMKSFMCFRLVIKGIQAFCALKLNS